MIEFAKNLRETCEQAGRIDLASLESSVNDLFKDMTFLEGLQEKLKEENLIKDFALRLVVDNKVKVEDLQKQV